MFSRKFISLGVPFLALVVGGSFGLRYFTSLRYEYSKRKNVSPAEAAELGIRMKSDKVTAESVLKDIKSKDIDTWENIRGPRPWEDSKTIQKELRNK